MVEIEGYKVVFEGEGDADGWSIIEDKPERTVGLIASHVACKPKDSDEYAVEADDEDQGIMSWFNNEDAFCWYCGDSVPAEIQALVHLAGSF